MKRLLAIVAIAAMAIAALPQVVAAVQPTFAGDHYKCYKAKGEFDRVRDVKLSDQFGDTTAVVIRPAFVCNPVEKTVGGATVPIQNQDLHYVCYLIREKPKLTPPDVLVNNQFQDDELLDIIKAKLLCVPSLKRILDLDSSE